MCLNLNLSITLISDEIAAKFECLQGGFSQSATGRGVLSMAALSHGVVRVDSEDSLTSLTLQDCGQVMPGASMVVVRSEGSAVLCKTDQVGEICVTSGATGSTYFGLDGMTNSSFKVQPLIEEPDLKSENSALITKPIGDEKNYVRSGLLGFLGPSGLGEERFYTLFLDKLFFLF